MTINNIVQNQTPVQSPGRRLFQQPANGSIGNSAFINPVTGDYEYSANGYTAGMTGVQQLVYLALVTSLGTSAIVNLGQTYSTIQVITSNINADIRGAVNTSLATLITAGSITLDSVVITRMSDTALEVQINWTDLTVTQSQSNLLNFGPSPGVIEVPTPAPFSGLDPSQVTSATAEGWWRADRGVVAQYGTVSAWFSEVSMDAGRDGYQATASKQPIFKGADAQLNGQPSIAFTGSQFLQTGTWTGYSILDPTAAFVVGYWKDNSGNYKAFDGYSGLNYFFENADGYLTIHETADATGGAALLGPQVYIVDFNGASSTYRQSTDVDQSFSGNPGSNTITGLTIGNGISGSFGGMTIAELAIFNGSLSSYDKDALILYAQLRYGI